MAATRRVVHSCEVESDDPDAVGGSILARRAVDRHLWQRLQPLERIGGERGFVPFDALHAGVHQRARGNRHRNRPDDVGTPGFFPIRQSSPVHMCRRHDVHGAAPLVLRGALEEDVSPANERAGTERGIHLVGRERHEVEMLGVAVRFDVDPAVGRQLGGVDEDSRADGVRLARETMDWLDEAGDVRGAAHCQQGNAIPECREQAVHIVFVKAPIARDLRPDRPGPGRARAGRSSGAPSRSRAPRSADRAGSGRRAC